MKKEVEILRKEILKAVSNDENIIGLFSIGSYGKGMITNESDRIVDVEEYKKAVILFYEINNISYFK